MQTIKDASLLLLVILILTSVRIQTTTEVSIDFPTTEASQSFQPDARPLLDHPALVKPSGIPAGAGAATQAGPANDASPKCGTPKVECDLQPRRDGPDDVEADCIA